MITGNFPNLRLRRSRKNEWSRRLVEENNLSSSDFILPIFLMKGRNKKQAILSMPGVYRYTLDKLSPILEKAIKIKIPMVALFPYIDAKNKDEFGTEALNENNLVCKAIRFIKKRFKNNIGIMSDVALDPYTSHGHDGLLKNNYVINDKTINVLIKQSLLQAQMGCDVIAPSDMMDGRVGKIRDFLDKNNYINIQIMSYSAKFSSSFYYPFREAIGSNYLGDKIDKSSYQINPGNCNEPIRGVSIDISEGADMIIVKPGMNYLDIIYRIKKTYKFPTFAYQVSGEYAMLENAFQKKILDKPKALIETLLCFKRAGADGIFTYFAMDAAKEIIKLK